jgi:hypothetical protein
MCVVDEEKPPVIPSDEIPEGLCAAPPKALDETAYKTLWRVNLELQEAVERLREKLREAQGRQAVAFRERARELLIARAGRVSI